MMLQFELYSKNRRPVADFLAKNRKAAKNVKLKTVSKVNDSNRESRAPIIKPTASWKKTEISNHVEGSQNSDYVGDGGTVTISKDYLDILLKRSVMMQPGGRGEEVKQIQANGQLQSHYSHHVSSVPGLDCSTKNTNTMPANTYLQPDTQVSLLPAGSTTGGRNKQGRRISSPEVIEEYFPFGRPGCGAPLRTSSGHIMADLRGGGYNPHHPTTSTYGMTQGSEHLGGRTSSISGGTIPVQPDLPSVQLPVPVGGFKSGKGDDRSSMYARGAGPHVNQYTLNEKAEKRKKELEHKAFLKEQILAKERNKRLAKEKAELEEKEEEIKFARERQRQQDEYIRERERATRKKDESRWRQTMLQQAIEKAEEQALCAKMESKATAPTAAACPNPTRSTPHRSHIHSHEPSHVASNSRGSRIPVYSKYLGGNKNNHITVPLRSHGTAGQQHQHDVMAQRREVGGGTRKRQQAITFKTKPCHAMAAKCKTTNSTVSLSKYGVRGEGYGGGIVSPPVPTLARKMRNTGQHPHTTSNRAPAHAKMVLNTQQDTSHNITTQVHMHHHQDKTVANNSSYRPTETLSSVDVGRREVTSPPVPALRKKQKAAAMTQRTVQQDHDDRTRMNNMGVSTITSHTHTYIPPVVKVPLIHEEKPHSHRQQVILQELAELRKGLMTHCSDVDHKLGTLLKDKNYSFLNHQRN